jgi:hypothetical protein
MAALHFLLHEHKAKGLGCISIVGPNHACSDQEAFQLASATRAESLQGGESGRDACIQS